MVNNANQSIEVRAYVKNGCTPEALSRLKKMRQILPHLLSLLRASGVQPFLIRALLRSDLRYRSPQIPHIERFMVP